MIENEFRTEAEHADLTVIIVYIPHKGRNDTPINQSSTYDELEQVTSTVFKHDCLIVMGDFNSRLACSDKTNNYMDKDLIGRWSIRSNDDQGCLDKVSVRSPQCFNRRKTIRTQHGSRLI